MTDPNNHSTNDNPVGRFMVAVGAVLNLKGTNKILITQRAANQDWQPNEWEIPYGRIDQHENLEMGLRRELKEEVGITELEIGEVVRHWHLYRGSKTAHNEVIGVTFACQTTQEKVQLSHEHQSYKWCDPKEAAELIAIEGIREDVQNYMQKGSN